MSRTLHTGPAQAEPAAGMETSSLDELARVRPLEAFLLKLPGFRSQVFGSSLRDEAIGQVAALASSLVATGLRALLDPMLPPGFPYLTFFPAVILTGFIWGIFPAITAGLLCGLAAWYWFIPPVHSFGLSYQAATALMFYVFVIAIDLSLLQLSLRALGSQIRAQQALERALAAQQIVSQEVDHRLKNLLATVSGLISLSQKHVVTSAELGAQLRQRIHAMSGSIALLRGATDAAGATVRGAILSALQPLGMADSPRLGLIGPDLRITAQSMIALNLVVFELATNAIKHGAFANQTGEIKLGWTVVPTARDRQTLHMTWRERGGPPVTPPDHAGFGTELITRMTRSMAGTCDLDYSVEGLTVTLSLDCQRISSDAG